VLLLLSIVILFRLIEAFLPGPGAILERLADALILARLYSVYLFKAAYRRFLETGRRALACWSVDME
jgi:hypothetical protein